MSFIFCRNPNFRSGRKKKIAPRLYLIMEQTFSTTYINDDSAIKSTLTKIKKRRPVLWQKPPIVSELDRRKTQRNQKKWRKLSLQSVESWNSSASERQVDRMMAEKDLSSDSAFLCSSSLFEKLIIEPLRTVLLLLFAVCFCFFPFSAFCFLVGTTTMKRRRFLLIFLKIAGKGKPDYKTVAFLLFG